MDAFIRLLTDITLSRFLIIAGILFLLLSVLKKFGAKIVVDTRMQKYARIIGAILLFAGIVINFIPESYLSSNNRQHGQPELISSKIKKKGTIIKKNDIIFNLQECRMSDSNITCYLQITSMIDIEPEDFIIHIRGDHPSKIVDYSGNEYIASSGTLGNKSNRRSVEDGLYANVDKKASLHFENISLSEEKIAVLELECFLLPGDRITVLFRDVPLSK